VPRSGSVRASPPLRPRYSKRFHLGLLSAIRLRGRRKRLAGSTGAAAITTTFGRMNSVIRPRQSAYHAVAPLICRLLVAPKEKPQTHCEVGPWLGSFQAYSGNAFGLHNLAIYPGFCPSLLVGCHTNERIIARQFQMSSADFVAISAMMLGSAKLLDSNLNILCNVCTNRVKRFGLNGG
jgi:hypothetical protein